MNLRDIQRSPLLTQMSSIQTTNPTQPWTQGNLQGLHITPTSTNFNCVSTCAGWRVTTKLINKAAAELAAQRSCCWALPEVGRFVEEMSACYLGGWSGWLCQAGKPRGKKSGWFVEVCGCFFENEAPSLGSLAFFGWKKTRPGPLLWGVSIAERAAKANHPPELTPRFTRFYLYTQVV